MSSTQQDPSDPGAERDDAQREVPGVAAAERDDAAVLKFIEHFALLLTDVGMQRMSARVFAALLVDETGGMTAADLADTLRISPAAVSGAVRVLTQMKFATRGRAPGERRDHYYVEDGFWYEAVQRDTLYQNFGDSLTEGIVAVGPETNAGRRLAETQDFFYYVAKALPKLLEDWRDERSR